MLNRRNIAIALLAVAAITTHLLMRAFDAPIWMWQAPLLVALFTGGAPLIWDLLTKTLRFEFGSDLLAGISIVTSVLLGEYLAGTFVVLMLSGGQALEAYAVQSASSVLDALAKRSPSIAHRKQGNVLEDVSLLAVAIGDTVVVLPHEICPVDGIVVEGHGVMDESYLTGEPYMMSKTPGSAVLSGAINGESALTIQAEKKAVDSRYSQIMEVMKSSAQHRPQSRRMGDWLGSIYTPIAIAVGIAAWVLSGEAIRFLAVMVVATPCPLLLAIPIAIIGTISLAARRGIIIRDPIVLEKIDTCRTVIFDKTGTLTYGQPHLVEEQLAPMRNGDELLRLVASMERYSKHPLAAALLQAAEARHLALVEASQVSEPPGQGMRGIVSGHEIQITSRTLLAKQGRDLSAHLPPAAGGLECVVLVDGEYAATYRFRDTPRREGAQFVHHLEPHHHVDRVLLVSGDRESEVAYLAKEVGIREVHGGKSPEEKVQIVRQETARAPTVFVGDGINDAPALLTATVGVAFGHNSDVTAKAAGAVVLDSSLEKVDELMHMGRRMRRVILQSAVGGMALSGVGMLVAAAGYLPPVAGAIVQEVIDVAAILNALRAASPPSRLSDF